MRTDTVPVYLQAGLEQQPLPSPQEVSPGACAELVVRHPLSTRLHPLHSLLLIALGRYGEAMKVAGRVVYLDRSLAVGHFTLGSILRRTGDLPGARRAFRNVRDLCGALPKDEAVPLGGGDTAGPLAQAPGIELEMLEAAYEGTR